MAKSVSRVHIQSEQSRLNVIRNGIAKEQLMQSVDLIETRAHPAHTF